MVLGVLYVSWLSVSLYGFSVVGCCGVYLQVVARGLGGSRRDELVRHLVLKRRGTFYGLCIRCGPELFGFTVTLLGSRGITRSVYRSVFFGV